MSMTSQQSQSGSERMPRIEGDHDIEGLLFRNDVVSDATPRYIESDIIAPIRTIGISSRTSLKASFWHCTAEETHQVGDLQFVSIALNTGGGRVWRNNETTPTDVGTIAIQPFESTRWRFEPPVSFTHLYVPFGLLGDVCESLFDRELLHTDLSIPAGFRNERFGSAVRSVHSGLISLEPTTLILDSWALMLAEASVRCLSRYAQRTSHTSLGKISARGVAHVVDYIEANIDSDLALDSLAKVAAMSVYHFARRFKETVGVSPHVYVLNRRVRRAQEQLRATQRGLADVAAACGFANQAHLTTTFRRLLGVTPGAYRGSVRR
jgi:AraC family transcriptional regulator